MASISVQSIVIVIIQAFVQMVNRHIYMKTELMTDRKTDKQKQTDKCSLVKTHNVI